MKDMTLAILAGGKSSRMNYNNKALLIYNKKKFIEHIIEAGKNFKEVIISSNNKEEYENFGLKVINDVYIDNGPLSGIHAVLNYANTEKVLCVACDMPYLSMKTLEHLECISEKYKEYDVVVPRINDRLQPLCAVYSKSILDKLEEALKNKDNKMQKIIMSLNYKEIEEDEFNSIEFSNINTPEDYRKMEENK